MSSVSCGQRSPGFGGDLCPLRLQKPLQHRVNALNKLWLVVNTRVYVMVKDKVKRAIVQLGVFDIVDFELEVGWDPAGLDSPPMTVEEAEVHLRSA